MIDGTNGGAGAGRERDATTGMATEPAADSRANGQSTDANVRPDFARSSSETAGPHEGVGWSGGEAEDDQVPRRLLQQHQQKLVSRLQASAVASGEHRLSPLINAQRKLMAASARPKPTRGGGAGKSVGGRGLGGAKGSRRAGGNTLDGALAGAGVVGADDDAILGAVDDDEALLLVGSLDSPAGRGALSSGVGSASSTPGGGTGSGDTDDGGTSVSSKGRVRKRPVRESM